MKKTEIIENVKLILALTILVVLIVELISQLRGGSIILSMMEQVPAFNTPINLPERWIFPIQVGFLYLVYYFFVRDKKRKK